jgi:hypothetical protein
VNVIATDNGTGALNNSKAVTINVTDVNEAPVVTSAATGTVAENAAISTVVYTATATDVDAGQTLAYSLGGADAASFAINASSGAVTLLSSANFEAKPSYSVNVIATDNGTGALNNSKAVTINVTDVNEAPVVTSAATGTVAENAAISTVIYTATATDVDAGQTLSYSLGGTDVASFAINASSGAVTLLSSADFEAKPSYNVNVIATDNGTGALNSSKAVTINVTNVNEAPVVTSSATGTVAENASISTVVYTTTATDVDTGQALSYSLGGTDAARFAINATSGAVTLLSSANFEAKPSYSVNVIATDNGTGALNSSKAVTINVTDVNEAPVVTSAATGTVAENAAISTVIYTATATDVDTGQTLSYSLGGTDAASFAINAASGAVTLLSSANFEAKSAYNLNVIATDNGGGALSATTGVTINVTDVNEAPTGSITVEGILAQGKTLTALSALTDDDGLGVLSYQWSAADTAIANAVSSMLTLTEAQVGKAITVTVSYRDGHGTRESVTSTATAPVTNVNDLPTGAVTINNSTPAQGQMLTVTNNVADIDGLGAITYQWSAGGVAIEGAISNTLILTEAQVGKAITVSANYTDGHGTKESPTSTATALVTNVNDSPTGGVTISGSPKQGQTLEAANSLGDLDGLGAITYQWNANGFAIPDANGSKLELAQAQVGKLVSVTAMYTDAHGKPESVTSGFTTVVANVNDAPSGGVTFTGTPTQGQTLNASNTLADADGLGTVFYQWFANEVAIEDAGSSSLVLADAQVGKTITVTASYVDGHGNPEHVTSNPSTAVANRNDPATGVVTFSGIAAQGQTLSASNTLADLDGLGAISYQWNANETAIDGARGDTLVLTQALVGKALSVTASYTDGSDAKESKTSASSDSVANTNDVPTGLVTIVGTATVGQKLMATNTLADVDGLGTVGYQWTANGVDIDGATASTLTLGRSLLGKTISVKAGYVDDFGTTENVSSGATTMVISLSDADGDQFPDRLEAANGLTVGVKDNDVFTSSKFFAMQLYRDILFREGESAGVQYWQSVIDAGALTRSQVARAFLDSAEFRAGAGEIVGLYLGTLERLPDIAGMDYWMEQLQAGSSLRQISSAFAADTEFSSMYGGLNDKAFVDQLYLNAMQRPADSAGETYWLARLQNGSARSEVVRQFIESPEFLGTRQAEINIALNYLGLLGRTPEQNGYSGWVAQHDAGVAEIAIIGAFLSSAEYHDRFLP